MTRVTLTTAQQQMNRENRTLLPRMAFSGFASRYREPAVKEGFEDITRVDFRVSLDLCFCLQAHGDARSCPGSAIGVCGYEYISWRLLWCEQFAGTEEQKAIWRRYWISSWWVEEGM